MGFVFLKSCGDVPFSFPNVDLATFTGNPVYAWLGLRALIVHVGLEVVMDLVNCVVENLDFVVVQDELNGVRSAAYVWEGDCGLVPRGLTLGIRDPLVRQQSWILLVDGLVSIQ